MTAYGGIVFRDRKVFFFLLHAIITGDVHFFSRVQNNEDLCF